MYIYAFNLCNVKFYMCIYVYSMYMYIMRIYVCIYVYICNFDLQTWCHIQVEFFYWSSSLL